MIAGSRNAGERANGKAVVLAGDRLHRFLGMAGVAASVALGACGAPVPRAVVAALPVASPAPPAAPPAEPPAPEPAVARVPELPVLTGLAPAEVIALMGEPDFRRRDPPAELWQYRSADCVLDVFIYGSGGNARVVRSQTRDRHVLPPLVAACNAAFDRGSRQSRL